MATVREIYRLIDEFAPFETQLDFDNAGFLAGRGEQEVSRVLVALDITQAVAEEAVRRGCQLIVSHHPVIFGGIKSMTDETVTGRVLLTLAENGLSAICAHTNLDAAEGGVNDCLAQCLGLSGAVLLEQGGIDRKGRPYGIGRVGMAHRPVRGGVCRLCEEAAERQQPAVRGRGGLRGPCGGGWRLLRLHAGAGAGRRLRHLRHRRCEI